MSDHVPPRTSVVTPYLCVRRCSAAIDWYVEVFGAVEDGPRYTDPDGRVGHASIRIGGAEIMLSDAYPDYGAVAPGRARPQRRSRCSSSCPTRRDRRRRGTGGGRVQRPVSEAFHGSRMGTLMDPFGVRWMVGTHVRDPGADEITAAADRFARTGAEPGPLLPGPQG